jgi:hypothetical protein
LKGKAQEVVGGPRRQLAEALMPRECARTPKIFQSVPISIWLRDPLTRLLHDALAPARIERSGLLDPAAVKRLIAEHLCSCTTGTIGTKRQSDASLPFLSAVAGALPLRDVIAHQHGRLVERATNHAAIDLRSEVPFVR